MSVKSSLAPRLHEVVDRICLALEETSLVFPMSDDQIIRLAQRMESKMIDCASAFVVETEMMIRR